MKVQAGQVAVITGAASGIGLGLATHFAALGLQLVLADHDAAGLALAADRLAEDGATVLAQPTDVADATAMTALRDAALGRFGGVDILCNNAGIVSPYRPLWDNPLADWERVIGANLWGVIHGIRLFVPAMVAAGRGHVVNTASMAGLIVVPSNGIYNATKHAVVSLSETLRADLEARGLPIGVTALCPGLVTSNIGSDAEVRATAKPAPVGAVTIAPAEVARQVVAAIEANRLYVTTNPGSDGPIRARIDRLLQETGQPL